MIVMNNLWGGFPVGHRKAVLAGVAYGIQLEPSLVSREPLSKSWVQTAPCRLMPMSHCTKKAGTAGTKNCGGHC